MKIASRSPEPWLLIGAFLLPYCALVIERNLAFPTIINPDGVNYAILAEEYSEGQIRNAVNAYWGPMISWLMAIPVAFGMPALTAYRIINIVVLFAIIVAVWRLTVFARFRPEIRFITLWTTGLMALAWSVGEMTPDLLMLLVMMLLFDQIVRLGDALPYGRVIAIGLLGGAGYLVKPFGLLFFIAIWSVVCAYIWARNRDAVSLLHVAQRWGLGLVAFLALVLPWALVLTWKYGHFTIGTSGRLNLTLVAPPGWPGPSSGPPARSFAEPPFPGSVVGLDPSLSTAPTWNPLASVDDMMHLARNVQHNVSDVIHHFALVGLVGLCVMTIALMGIVRARAGVPELCVRATIFAALYVGMYCLVLVNTRYIWPAILIMCIAGFSLVNAWSLGNRLPRWTYAAVALPLALSMVIGPDWRPGMGVGRATIDAMYAPNAVWRTLAADARDAANSMQESYRGTSIASNHERAKSMYVSYFLDSEYFGDVIDGEPPEVTRERLSAHDIDVFLYWGEPGDPTPAYLADYTLSDSFEDGRLKVYTRGGAGPMSRNDQPEWRLPLHDRDRASAPIGSEQVTNSDDESGQDIAAV